MNQKWLNAGVAALAVLGLIVGLVALNQAGTAYQEMGLGGTGVTNLDSLTLSDDLVVGDTSTLGAAVDITSGGLTVTAGGLTVTAGGATVTAGGLTVSDGDVVVADDLRVAAQTAITVTNGNAFTPTGTYQPIQAGSEVTPTVTIGTAGDVVVLINTSANTINIADSGTMKLASAVALGQYDTLTLWCDGTNWLQIATANN